jgi:hypothetical protein
MSIIWGEELHDKANRNRLSFIFLLFSDCAYLFVIVEYRRPWLCELLRRNRSAFTGAL